MRSSQKSKLSRSSRQSYQSNEDYEEEEDESEGEGEYERPESVNRSTNTEDINNKQTTTEMDDVGGDESIRQETPVLASHEDQIMRRSGALNNRVEDGDSPEKKAFEYRRDSKASNNSGVKIITDAPAITPSELPERASPPQKRDS